MAGRDAAQDGFFGLAEGAGLVVFVEVALDHLSEGDADAGLALDGARLVQLALPSLGPGLGGLPAREGLALLINLDTIPFDSYLRGVTGRAVSPFARPDRDHGGTPSGKWYKRG
ncbi:hypothetical protein D3C84_1062980 [compost metagenome]